MALLFDKEGKNIIDSFSKVSKFLAKNIESNNHLYKQDIVILKLKLIQLDAEIDYEYFYLDREMADKYNITDNSVIEEDEFYSNNKYKDFNTNIELVLTSKLSEFLANLKSQY